MIMVYFRAGSLLYIDMGADLFLMASGTYLGIGRPHFWC